MTPAPAPTPEPTALPVTVNEAAALVGAVYGAAEQRLLVDSAVLVRQAVADAAAVPSLRARLQQLAVNLANEVLARTQGLAATVADTASRRGAAAAAQQLRDLERRTATWRASPVSAILPHSVQSSLLIAEDLHQRLDAAAYRITRFADDAYRAATVSGALAQVHPHLDVVRNTLQHATPAEAQAQAWRELMAKGITGFTDSAGRNWNLATYVEMATRTATQRAYNASHRERLTQMGVHYFTISTTGRPCGLCAPWEGVVLADEPGTHTEDGHTFTVQATIEDATAAGLFHPNCKHTLQAYLPGFTVLQPNQWTPADEQAYKDTQRLRALERAVRQAKQVQATALNDIQRRRVGKDVRAAQAAVRDHVAATGLNRRSRREQLNLGNKEAAQ